MLHHPEITRWHTCAAVLLALVFSAWPAAPVLALHETDHRYDLMGYVLDENEQPVAGVRVVGHLGNEPMGSGSSDSRGYYRFRMHLHDSDQGRELRVKTADAEGTVRVTLTPGDTSTERIHHVNFIGGKLVEGELSGRGGGFPTPALIAGGAAILLAGGFVAARQLRRARRRRARAEQKAAKEHGGGASKRRKRKKRRR